MFHSSSSVSDERKNSFPKSTAETRAGFVLKTNLQAWPKGQTAEDKAEVSHNVHCCGDAGDDFLSQGHHVPLLPKHMQEEIKISRLWFSMVSAINAMRCGGQPWTTQKWLWFAVLQMLFFGISVYNWRALSNFRKVMGNTAFKCHLLLSVPYVLNAPSILCCSWQSSE